MKKTRMDSDRKWKVCLIKVPLFLLKNACGASYKPFYIFFVVPLWGHFRMGILTKIKKWKVKCLYFCELQQELYVHNTFLTFSIFQPTLIEKETSRHDKEKDEAGNRRYNYIDLLRIEANTWKILDISTNVSVAKLVII